jgi:hypothetical protein
MVREHLDSSTAGPSLFLSVNIEVNSQVRLPDLGRAGCIGSVQKDKIEHIITG